MRWLVIEPMTFIPAYGANTANSAGTLGCSIPVGLQAVFCMEANSIKFCSCARASFITIDEQRGCYFSHAGYASVGPPLFLRLISISHSPLPLVSVFSVDVFTNQLWQIWVIFYLWHGLLAIKICFNELWDNLSSVKILSFPVLYHSLWCRISSRSWTASRPVSWKSEFSTWMTTSPTPSTGTCADRSLRRTSSSSLSSSVSTYSRASKCACLVITQITSLGVHTFFIPLRGRHRMASTYLLCWLCLSKSGLYNHFIQCVQPRYHCIAYIVFKFFCKHVNT